MALNCAANRAKLLVPPCSKSLSTFSRVDHSKKLKARKVPFLKISPLVPMIRPFHHQNIIQLYIQQGSGGILFDALQNVQKSRERLSRTTDTKLLSFDIPDDLRRLKQGSLKWLLAVWPVSSGKSYSALTTIKGALQSELKNEGDDEVRRRFPQKTEKVLRSSSEQQLFDVLDYLKARNIAIRRLIRLPWLLTADPEALEEGVRRVRLWLKVEPFEVAISFVNLRQDKLQEAGFLWRREGLEGTRLKWLAGRLRCGEEDIGDMMARWPKLMTLSLEHIDNVLDALLEELKVKPETIVGDPWVFQGNLNTLLQRKEVMRRNGILEVKPWVFRTPQRKFERFVKTMLEERSLLGEHKNVKGFLEERLGGAEEMMAKVPSLRTATVIKLNEMIEFLREKGFSREQIRETPRVLGHSVETIAERLEEISAYSKQSVISLPLLCRTSKDYKAIMRKMKREARAKAAANKTSKKEERLEEET